MSTIDAFDRRLTPARPDLAAEHLKGRVEAERFVAPTPMQVTAGIAPLHRAPERASMQETQLLYGEDFAVYETRDGWCWGQAAQDGYVGYVEEASLSRQTIRNTHRVITLATFRYAEPDMKSQKVGVLPMNAKLQPGAGAGDKYLREARGAWVFSGHLAPLADSLPDYTAVAEAMTGVPYLWGGRSTHGLDCSGLVQNALERRGLFVPRDTDMQEAWMAENGAGEIFRRRREKDDWSGLALHRGDILFWKGHVAIMVDGEDMIHANATAMAVSVDEARTFAGRVSAEAGKVTSIWRL